MKYKLTDELDRQRLTAFKSDDPANLEDELDLARLQLEKAINANNQGAAAAWANIVSRLAKTHEDAQARRNHYIHKDAMLRMCHKLIELIATDYRTLGVNGWEDRVELLTGQMGRVIEYTKNTLEEVEAIT